MRQSITCFLSALILGGTLFMPPPAKSAGSVTARMVNTSPFTDTAVIPADADTRSIRLESVKTVQLPSRIRYTSDPAWCDHALYEPGGSAFCPQIRMDSPVTAIEVTYSYSDNSLGQLTFQVYFQPSALPSALRETLTSGRKSNRARLARYFEVATRRDPAPRYILDPSRSFICPGTYIDGNWQPDEPDCDITIRTRTVQGLSDFLTVTVTPVAQ